jgi:hypothetical protein
VAAAKTVVATTSFACEVNGAELLVHAGDVFASTHPAVEKHRELFATATAASGEVR